MVLEGGAIDTDGAGTMPVQRLAAARPAATFDHYMRGGWTNAEVPHLVAPDRRRGHPQADLAAAKRLGVDRPA